MESAHPYIARLRTYQLYDTFFHLACSLVCKRQCQNTVWVDTKLYQVCYAVGQRACLAAAGTGYYHHRTLSAFSRFALWFIQLFKQFTHMCYSYCRAKLLKTRDMTKRSYQPAAAPIAHLFSRCADLPHRRRIAPRATGGCLPQACSPCRSAGFQASGRNP